MTNGNHEANGRMPVIFAGHGSPMNAVQDNPWSQGFVDLAAELPRPRAILAISAHWYVAGTYLMANAQPRTLHDFGGFPQALYEIEYPARGDVKLAERVRDLLGEQRASLDTTWGLDHGTWSVLRWMFPKADVPVVQLSIDQRLHVREHHALGRELAPLRDEGVLIFGSGNIVHNLPDAFTRMRTGNRDTPDWASRFDAATRDALEAHDSEALLALSATDDGRLAHPSADHWIPLLYAHGASTTEDEVRFSSEGFDLGSLSMRNVRFG